MVDARSTTDGPGDDPVDLDTPDTERLADVDASSERVATPRAAGMGPARITSIVVGVLVAGLVVLFALGRSDETTEASLLGERTPPLAGPVLGGGTYDIDDRQGSWVLVNFFATWCPPCVAEHPELVALEAWGASRGDLELVSVRFDPIEPPERIQEFFDQRGGNWPVVDSTAASVDFRVSRLPESFLVAPSGVVVLRVEGQVEAAAIQRFVEDNT
jgi:cytochrome c biogenesis protein CcmG/thiol:disulfide interchange protein DsbE